MTVHARDARAWFARRRGVEEAVQSRLVDRGRASSSRWRWIRDKTPVRAATSNVGHCLACGIIDADTCSAVVGRMFAPDMFSGWGIRTLSADHRYYNPLSYHRGTVWAVEQATMIFGLRRFGFDARAHDLARALFDLAALYPKYRIPECVGGYPRGDAPAPGAYPRANTPQLWNATAFPARSCRRCGDPAAGAVRHAGRRSRAARLAAGARLRDLRVGGATVTLRFWRDARGRSKFQVLHKRGTLHVVRQPPPESLSADLWQRLHGVMESVA